MIAVTVRVRFLLWVVTKVATELIAGMMVAGWVVENESYHIITHHDTCVHDSYPTINNHHYTKNANTSSNNNHPSHLSSPSTIIDPLTIIPGHLHNYTNIINLTIYPHTIIYPHNDENNIEIMRRCSSYGSYGYNRIRWTDTR